MILISHRGNISGKNLELENKPEYILKAIQEGFQVEIDVWYTEGKFKLGHDEPLYDFPISLLEEYHSILWIHCKNHEALVQMNLIDKVGVRLNYFFHDVDYAVLTSKGYIWTIHPIENSILVMPEATGNIPSLNTIGVCSDCIINYV